MSLIEESHDSLPYLDQDATPKERAQIDKLIASQLPPDYQTNLHPSIPALSDTRFSTLIQQELQRKAAGFPLTGGIDLSRYEAPEPPSSDDEKNETPDAWRVSLQKAYISSSHLSARSANLSLLEEYGKNAWLIGNSQLEDILRQVEKELVETKEATESVNKARKAAQEGSKGEMVGLEDIWKQSVGRTLETEVAAEKPKRDILEMRRQQSR